MKKQAESIPFKELFGRGLRAEDHQLFADFFVGFGSTRIPSGIASEKIGQINSSDQAAFIVRAVNSHEVLLEAAKQVVAPYMDKLPIETPDSILALIVAIAKAEGE